MLCASLLCIAICYVNTVAVFNSLQLRSVEGTCRIINCHKYRFGCDPGTICFPYYKMTLMFDLLNLTQKNGEPYRGVHDNYWVLGASKCESYLHKEQSCHYYPDFIWETLSMTK